MIGHYASGNTVNEDMMKQATVKCVDKELHVKGAYCSFGDTKHTNTDGIDAL